jgi:hypothetical protein
MAMRTLALVLGVAAIVPSAVEAMPGPVLKGAVVAKAHVVVALAPGELTPGQVVVSTKRARRSDGTFTPTAVRLRERLTGQVDAASGMLRYRTTHALAPGVYFVAVSGYLQDPPADCLPGKSHCNERWSNVIRISVPRPKES